MPLLSAGSKDANTREREWIPHGKQRTPESENDGILSPSQISQIMLKARQSPCKNTWYSPRISILSLEQVKSHKRFHHDHLKCH